MMVTPETAHAALTPATKAVIAVHLFGNVAPVREIEALGVPVLEDAAQAAGSTGPDGRPGDSARRRRSASSRPRISAVSGTAARSPPPVRRSPSSRGCCASTAPGTSRRGSSSGYNSRLDEIQAAFLRVQLPELDTWARGRCTAAAHYERAGLGELVALPSPTPGASAAWHIYVIRSEHVATISQALSAAEIGNRAYYTRPIHRHPAMTPYVEALELPMTDVWLRHTSPSR